MISVNEELSMSSTSRPAPKTFLVFKASIKSVVLTIVPLLVFNSQKGLLNFSIKILLNKLNVKFVCGKCRLRTSAFSKMLSKEDFFAISLLTLSFTS